MKQILNFILIILILCTWLNFPRINSLEVYNILGNTEIKPTSGHVWATKNSLCNYEIEFDVNIKQISNGGGRNILHVTTGNDCCSGQTRNLFLLIRKEKSTFELNVWYQGCNPTQQLNLDQEYHMKIIVKKSQVDIYEGINHWTTCTVNMNREIVNSKFYFSDPYYFQTEDY